jgi:subtilisin-like proprotein convertase family protein
MKNILVFILIFFLVSSRLSTAQVFYNNKVDSILNLVSVQSITKMNKELSGDTITTIGGFPQIIPSRYWQSPGNTKASQYIFEKFQSYGLAPKYMVNNATNIHVYAVKTGIKYPNKKFIIGAHYDDIINGGIIPDTIYGADDNASGVCAVLESARLLANMNLNYTVIFVAFDEEEDGGTSRGSVAFADSLYFRGDTVLGVLNVDMIGYHTNNNNLATILTDTNSFGLYNDITGCNQIYNLDLSFYPIFNANLSDHQSFIDRGYKAFTFIEDYYRNFNPYWHSLNDRFSRFNIDYFYKSVKVSIATLLTWASDYHISMNHIPLKTSSDTSARIAKVYIKSPFKLGSGANAPRLYYKSGNGVYNFVNVFSIVQDTFKFMIPGKQGGNQISYYFALQDSAGSNAVTLPSGGSGMNPPGTTPPPQPYTYYILGTLNISSNTVPKPTTASWTRDTIHIQQTGTIININLSLNINHTNDGDLLLRLQKVSAYCNLSQFNGIWGQNYTNTIFDDSASMFIMQGSPPFTGRFKPQSVLSSFNGQELSGDWILGVFDKGTGNTGMLLNWSLEITYTSTISIKETSSLLPDNFLLFQNYPNPFNPSTKIAFKIPGSLSRLYREEGYGFSRGVGLVSLKIYDITGREVQTLVNEELQPGTYEVTFDGSLLTSGVYFYQLRAGNFIETKKMLLIK